MPINQGKPIRDSSMGYGFQGQGHFACRHCQRIAYASQSDDAMGRAWRKQAKIEEKPGPNWTRPKGMHDATRERPRHTASDREQRRDAAPPRSCRTIC